MFVGHYAVGLAMKAYKPDTPTLPILFGVVFMDIIYGLFVIVGIDKITPNLDATPYMFFDLTHVDWDHSLVMAVVWSLVWGLLFIKNKSVALIAALAVFSHFVVDWPMHNSDLALYPHSDVHLGLSLWGSMGTGAWLLEGVFAALLTWYFWRSYNMKGVNMLLPAVFMLVMFLQLSPWTSPMQFIATLPEPTVYIVHGVVILLGFVVPVLIFDWLIKRAIQRSKTS